jgi:hypothetical protein
VSVSSFDKVGLCFCDFALRFFFSSGSARVGGGAPMASRAAAFTADAALNGFGLRGLEGIFLISSLTRIPDEYNGLSFHEKIPAALQHGL